MTTRTTTHHLTTTFQTPSLDQVVKHLQKWTEKIRKLEVDIRNKDDNKEVGGSRP